MVVAGTKKHILVYLMKELENKKDQALSRRGF